MGGENDEADAIKMLARDVANALGGAGNCTLSGGRKDSKASQPELADGQNDSDSAIMLEVRLTEVGSSVSRGFVENKIT